jgi:hypothetical protein
MLYFVYRIILLYFGASFGVLDCSYIIIIIIIIIIIAIIYERFNFYHLIIWLYVLSVEMRKHQ